MKDQLILLLAPAYPAEHNRKVRFVRLDNGMHVLRELGTGFAPTAEPRLGDEHIPKHLVPAVEPVLPLDLPTGATGAYSRAITVKELRDAIANQAD